MSLDRKYLVSALFYVVLGMALGIYMAASHNHTQHITHAHILLVGFVVSFIYAAIHKLWLSGQASRLATIQFVTHQAGSIIMFVGLFLLYGDIMPAPQVETFLAPSTIIVFAAAVMMIIMVLRNK